MPEHRLLLVNLRGRRDLLTHADDREKLAGLLRGHQVESLIVDPFGRAYSSSSQNDAGPARSARRHHQPMRRHHQAAGTNPTTEELTHDHHTVRELPSVPVW